MQSKGSKNDEGKARWDLLDWGWLSEITDILTLGAEKYSPNNWQVVPGARRRYIAALWRHVVAWLRGEKLDPEDKKHHLAHAACNLMFLFWLDSHEEVPDETTSTNTE